MQHLRAGGRDFLRFRVVQSCQQSRIGNLARICAEQTGYVGPDFNRFCAEQGTKARRRGIRSATPKNDGLAIGLSRDETLGDKNIAKRG